MLLLLLCSLAGAAPLTTVDATLTWEVVAVQFGRSVAGIGDTNGDGYADLAVGAPEGREAYVYLGSAGGFPATPSTTLSPARVTGGFGRVVAGAGDIDGDGYADLLVSAAGRSGSDAQTVSVYPGSPTGPSVRASQVLSDDDRDGGFGFAAAGAGDVNGDGYADVVVGAPYRDGNRGRAYAYLGGPDGLGQVPTILATGTDPNTVGSAVAGVGDVNGDGYDDVVVGVASWETWRGKALLFLGSASGLPVHSDQTLGGFSSYDLFGMTVAGAGDVDGDGYDDVLVGAPGYGTHDGRVYLYRGSAAGLEAAPTTILTGADARSYFGMSVAGAGDLNGDGYADVVVGAPADTDGQGYVGIYRGAATGLDWATHAEVEGEGMRDQFGISVTGLGDVDGDGLDDFAVGALGSDARPPRVEVYGGAAAGP